MKRLFLIILILLVLLVAAVLGGYAYLSAQDAEQIRRRAEAGLESALGRDVALKGPVTVTLTPLPAITVSDVTIGNASWGTRPEMLTVTELQLIPNLRRLLLGKIELREVRISGAQLFLENGSDGQGNWQFKPTGAHTTGEFPVSIRSLIINDLHAAYLGSAAGMTREIDLEQLQISTASGLGGIRIQMKGQVLKQALAADAKLGRFEDLMAGRPFPVDLNATIGDTTLAVSGQIDDADFRDYKGIRLHFEASGRRPVVLMGWTHINMPPLDSFSLAGDLDSNDELLGLSNLQCHLTATGYDLILSGRITSLPALEGMSIDFKGSGDTITQMLPWSEEEFTAKGQFDFAGHLSGSKAAPNLDAVSMNLQIPGVTTTMEGSVSDLHDGGKVDARISVKAEGLMAVGKRLHVDLPDLDGVDLSGQLTGTLVAPGLQDIRGTLTEGSLKAHVSGAIAALIETHGVNLDLELTGGDVADLGDLLGIKGFPHTESTRASGSLRGDTGDLDLTVTDGRLARKDGTQLHVSGSVDNLDAAAKLDLRMYLTGTNVKSLDQLASIPIPDTQSYSVAGRLAGLAKSPDLEEVDAKAQLENVTVTVQGRFPDVLEFGEMDARIEVQGDDLSVLGKQLNQAWPESQSFKAGGQVHGSTSSPILDDLAGRLGTDQVDVSFSGRVGNVVDGEGFDLQVKAAASSLAAFFPVGGHAWDALGNSDAKFSIQGDMKRFRVDLAELNAGKSSFTGEFTYSRAAPDQPQRIEGAFRESVLDFTPWLGGDDEPVSGSTAGKPAAPIFSATPFDLGWMKTLELDVDLSAVELAAGPDRIDLVHGKLGLNGGSLSLDPMQLNYLGAAIDGKLELMDGPPPRLSLQTLTKDLNFGQLAQRTGLSDDARGSIDLKVDLDAAGLSPSQMATSASGQIMMLMTKGFVGGKELPLHFGEVFVHLMPWVKGQKGIDIECGMLDLPVSGGVADVQFFVLDTTDMLMRGQGQIDLGKETYDLLLIPRAKKAKALAHKVDVRVVGTLEHPEIRYDATAAGLSALEAVGRFALLGPAGIFVDPNNFRSERQECAESLDQVQNMK